MTDHKVGTREEWLAARLKRLEAEKAHTRRGDELTEMRKALPWVRIDKGYTFDTEGGEASLADLFRGRSQLLVYHFMFDPDWDQGCPSCSAIADGFDETHLHLQNHDVAFTAASRGPLNKLLGYRDRMGWTFRLRPRLRRSLDHVAVARPGAARPQRGRRVVVPAPRPVQGQLQVTIGRPVRPRR